MKGVQANLYVLPYTDPAKTDSHHLLFYRNQPSPVILDFQHSLHVFGRSFVLSSQLVAITLLELLLFMKLCCSLLTLSACCFPLSHIILFQFPMLTFFLVPNCLNSCFETFLNSQPSYRNYYSSWLPVYRSNSSPTCCVVFLYFFEIINFVNSYNRLLTGECTVARNKFLLKFRVLEHAAQFKLPFVDWTIWNFVFLTANNNNKGKRPVLLIHKRSRGIDQQPEEEEGWCHFGGEWSSTYRRCRFPMLNSNARGRLLCCSDGATEMSMQCAHSSALGSLDMWADTLPIPAVIIVTAHTAIVTLCGMQTFTPYVSIILVSLCCRRNELQTEPEHSKENNQMDTKKMKRKQFRDDKRKKESIPLNITIFIRAQQAKMTKMRQREPDTEQEQRSVNQLKRAGENHCCVPIVKKELSLQCQLQSHLNYVISTPTMASLWVFVLECSILSFQCRLHAASRYYGGTDYKNSHGFYLVSWVCGFSRLAPPCIHLRPLPAQLSTSSTSLDLLELKTHSNTSLAIELIVNPLIPWECYDLVTPFRTCQGFPQLGDYLQPPHLCTFPNTLQITLPPPIAADLLPSFPPLPIQPVAAALLPSPPRIPVHPAADLLPFPPLVHPISASR
ncbi:hypothetical protein VP01_3750g1 [Puccinia sorghi]|uniref:Uncharacterized protein n=1 Tax=Puccinia sorghi TaxID=27349 RepID=A0A0L6UTT6_9BASI|nr:hypothetical protein VP01_3750g1 [Puccinia sorghi]